MSLSRRQFLRRAGAASVGFAGLRIGLARGDMVRALAGRSPNRYGPLLPDPRRLFDLPKGFSYTVISRFGEEMDDGLLVPGRHDGMAAFPRADGKTVLVCNHEIEQPAHGPIGPFGKNHARRDRAGPGRRYDAGDFAIGGTTTVVYDTKTNTRERIFLSLCGTVRNCAGGPTPWGSWLTCEETTALKGDREKGDERTDGYQQDHGYVFEVPSDAHEMVAEPKPIKAMGRFRHEAVCVDPRTGIVYLTEDIDDGLIYRFIPKTIGKLQDGGKLQALRSRVTPSLCTRNWQDSPRRIEPGVRIPVSWVDLDDIDAPKNDLRVRGYALGAARFARAEGMWFGDATGDQRSPAAFWACTTGGTKSLGQVWRYTPSTHEGTSGEGEHPGHLELFIEPNDSRAIANADNLCVAPWGGLFVCEDSGLDVQRLIGVSAKGECSVFGSNAGSGSELAGVCVSPDETTLFVNIQNPGTTIAIQGPFAR